MSEEGQKKVTFIIINIIMLMVLITALILIPNKIIKALLLIFVVYKVLNMIIKVFVNKKDMVKYIQYGMFPNESVYIKRLGYSKFFVKSGEEEYIIELELAEEGFGYKGSMEKV